MAEERIRVLLIEDNPADVRLVREALREASGVIVELEPAPQLSAGLAALKRGRFDVVLVDMSLPDSRGIETFTKLQEKAEDIPIVILSGMAEEGLAYLAVQMGAQDYLSKSQIATDSLVHALKYSIERKRHEDSRAHMAEFLETSDLAVFGQDLEGIVTAWNRGAAKLYGYSPSEVMGKPSDFMIPAGRAEEWKFLRERIARGESVQNHETVHLRKDGQQLIVSFSLFTVKDKLGRVTSTLAFANDITERIHTQRERTGILAVSQAVASTRTVEDLAEVATRSLKESLQHHAALLYLVDPDRKRLLLASQHGLRKEGVETMSAYPLERGFPSVAVATYFAREVQVVTEMQSRRKLAHAMEYIRKHGLQILISAPILLRDECLGVLQVVTDEKRFPRAEEIATLRVVCENLAVGIDQKLLFMRLQETAQGSERAQRELDVRVRSVLDGIAPQFTSLGENLSNLKRKLANGIAGDTDVLLDWMARDFDEIRSSIEALRQETPGKDAKGPEAPPEPAAKPAQSAPKAEADATSESGTPSAAQEKEAATEEPQPTPRAEGSP